MLNNDYKTALLDLEEAIVKKVEKCENEVYIHIELPRKPHKCPCCGETTEKIHDYRTQRVKDIPLGRTTYLYLKSVDIFAGAVGSAFMKAIRFWENTVA